MNAPDDILLLVPFDAGTGLGTPEARRGVGAHLTIPLSNALAGFGEFMGRAVGFRDGNFPRFSGEPLEFAPHRSLTAVTLATELEAGGLRWRVLDPGVRSVPYWRNELQRFRTNPPRVVGVSTTFILDARFLRALLYVIREVLPSSKILLGGYFYASNTKEFLAMDADFMLIGEGERRFRRVVRAVLDGGPLGDIPGVYIRQPSGTLSFTGSPTQIPMDELAPVDWRLASRIEPTVDYSRDMADFGLETQRGCVFKCEFCTYRTLSTPNFMSTDLAVDRIFATQVAPRGFIRLEDATATFPTERWTELLEKIIARGGAPHPIWAYARVSDINDRVAELMGRAGVREVFVGQESGDQRILHLMKKGTHVNQVKPAVRALQKNGVFAFFSFIHGFPGETPETAGNTRAMISGLNDELPEGQPAVLWYDLSPMIVQDFASIAPKVRQTEGGKIWQTYANTHNWADEVLATMIAVSRNPKAPVHFRWLTTFDSPTRPMDPEPALMGKPYRVQFHRWMKQAERGIMLFAEHQLEGKPLELRELRRIKEEVLAAYPTTQRHTRIERVRRAVRQRVFQRLGREFIAEPSEGAGPLTRVVLAGFTYSEVRNTKLAWEALTTGESYAPPKDAAKIEDHAGTSLASEAIDRAKTNGKDFSRLLKQKRSKLATSATAPETEVVGLPDVDDTEGDEALKKAITQAPTATS